MALRRRTTSRITCDESTSGSRTMYNFRARTSSPHIYCVIYTSMLFPLPTPLSAFEDTML